MADMIYHNIFWYNIPSRKYLSKSEIHKYRTSKRTYLPRAYIFYTSKSEVFFNLIASKQYFNEHSPLISAF